MSSSQRFAFLLLAAGGCTAVYDAQYDDRASELEEFRTEFLPGSDQVRFFTAAPQKLFWQSLEKPLDAPLLHSIDTSTQARIDYEFSRGDNNIDSRTQMSNTLIVKCSFGTTTAFDATVSNRMIDMTTMGSDDCAVDGSTVYFAVARTIRRWTPGAGPPAQVVDLAAAGVGTASIAGVAVLGNNLLLAEGPRLWLIDVTTGVATWLENEGEPSGLVAFDDRGVVFDTFSGPIYIQFSDHSELLLSEAIADGGYLLNREHADIQDLASTSEFTLHDKHVIYRGKQGIFAYGFETKKVVDLLLDRGGLGSEALPTYHDPAVTADGTLFVQDLSQATSGLPHPVYRVDLNGRLK